ncbi:MAG: Asp-tRNA(Asn)/Glu-tRNA(Gln) amidotransferase subunit GatA, partial [Anaerolineaceae bacterium]|nr:Asp-tRNA(Asn)/Glu-tRNA(Gln) amidotransferase subunit GatA [Anaerolineaceae bacterium]
LGLPAISVPCGFTAEGLPLGLQLVGAPLDEVRVLRAAYAYEQVASFSGPNTAI